MGFQNTRLICNIGTIQDAPNSANKAIVYLGVTFNTNTNRNEYFRTSWRPAFTDVNGNAIPAQWVYMNLRGVYGIMNMAQSFSNLQDIAFAGDDSQFYGLWAGIVANLILNDSTIRQTTTNLTLPVTTASPTAYSILGGGITSTMVSDLTGVTNDIVPTESFESTPSLNDPTRTLISFNGVETDIEEFALDVTPSYVDTALVAFKNPIDFVKKNPVSGVVIGAVAYEALAIATGLWPGIVTGKKPLIPILKMSKKGRR